LGLPGGGLQFFVTTSSQLSTASVDSVNVSFDGVDDRK
jgi:hypothetical protein